MTSHQESDLKAALNQFNIALLDHNLLRPKSWTIGMYGKTSETRKRNYNKRIRKIKQKIELLSKVLGIPVPEFPEGNPDGFNFDAANPAAFVPHAGNPDVDPDVVNPDAVNPDVVKPDADNLVVVKLEC